MRKKVLENQTRETFLVHELIDTATELFFVLNQPNNKRFFLYSYFNHMTGT